MPTTDVLQSIRDRIAAAERAVKGAREKWTSTSVRLTGFLGGGDPAQVLGAIASIESRGVRPWASRGLAFTRAADQAALDAWTKQGAELIRDLESIADYSSESRIERIVVDTVKASADDAVTVVKAAGGWIADAAVFVRKHWRWIALGTVAVVIVVAVVRFRVAVG